MSSPSKIASTGEPLARLLGVRKPLDARARFWVGVLAFALPFWADVDIEDIRDLGAEPLLHGVPEHSHGNGSGVDDGEEVVAGRLEPERKQLRHLLARELE